jgi:predicted ATP-dependent protease
MTPYDKMVDDLVKDRDLAYEIESIVGHTFRPIREDRSLGFDYERITRFTMPDSMSQRVEVLVEHITREVAKRVIPILAKDASDEAKHNLIRKLGQVLQ